MSAPDGDLERQAKNHRGPLRGMFAMVLFALVLLAGLVFFVARSGGDPEGAETQVQTGTGTVEEGAADDAITANDNAAEEQGAGTGGEADPAAVTVAPETVAAPDSGAGVPADTDPGESQSAEPLDPVGDGGEGSTPATE